MSNSNDYVSLKGGFDRFFADQGGVAHPITTEVIDVKVGADSMLRAYGQAVVDEAQRTNPTLFNVEPITIDEIMEYAQFLLQARVDLVNVKPGVRVHQFKQLWIPVFIQHVLSSIGIVDYYKIGLKVRPIVEQTRVVNPQTQETMQSDGDITSAVESSVPGSTDTKSYNLDAAEAFSCKLSKYRDGLQMVQNAMPSDFKGDPDVMSCAVINDYVRSLKQDTHPAAAYVAAFAGFQLVEQTSLAALYRIQYDDMNFIKGMYRGARGIL